MPRNFTAKLPSDRVTTELDSVRRQAKNARKPQILQELYEHYSYDEIICWNIANNSAANTYTREKLAKHKNPKIRYIIAQHSEELESEKVLMSLSFDIPLIREQVARTTTSEPIKEMLFKWNPSNSKIRAFCLKRMHKIDIVQKFILSASQESLCFYGKSILENQHLTINELLAFIITIDKLSDEHIDLIHKHSQYDEKYFSKLLARFEKIVID